MSAESPLVYAAVLHYGVNPDGSARTLLRETLDSLLTMTYPNLILAVIDNGSTDGSPEMVRKEYPGVRLIENGANLGVGEGYNVGLKEGLRAAAEWVLLLNNDIIADPEMLSAMMAAATAGAGIAGPKTYFYDKPTAFWYAGGRINLFTGIVSHRGIREEDLGQYDRTEETGYVNGCAMLIRRTVIETIGYMDPVFHPAYAEDADYSMRAARAGFRLLYIPGAKLWHKVSSSSGGGATPMKTRLKVEHNFLLLRRYAQWYHWLTIPWCAGAAALAFVARELGRGNFRIVAALAKGLLSIFRKST